MDGMFFDLLTNGPFDWVQGKYVNQMTKAEREKYYQRHPDRQPKSWRKAS